MLVAGNVVLSDIWGHLIGFGCIVHFLARAGSPVLSPCLLPHCPLPVPGAWKKYPMILCKVILDTCPFILGYIAKYPWMCYFLISPGTFPIHKLNQWTVLWKSYRISCHLPWNCTASVDTPAPSGVAVSSVWRCQDILFHGIPPGVLHP